MISPRLKPKSHDSHRRDKLASFKRMKHGKKAFRLKQKLKSDIYTLYLYLVAYLSSYRDKAINAL